MSGKNLKYFCAEWKRADWGLSENYFPANIRFTFDGWKPQLKSLYSFYVSLLVDLFNCHSDKLRLNLRNSNLYAIPSTRELTLKVLTSMYFSLFPNDPPMYLIHQVPQWKELKNVASPHKDKIQRVELLRASNRYLTISKDGIIAFWNHHVKLQRHLRISTDTVKSRYYLHFIDILCFILIYFSIS